MTRTSLFTAIALATLALYAGPAAHAQSLTLNDGDAATVDGTGTHGTINGQTVANNTTSYSSSGNAVQTFGASTFTLGTGGTLTAGNSGVGLDADGSGPVTINGGTLTAGQGGIGLFAGGSPVTINGGTFTVGPGGVGLDAQGSSPVTINGGTFTAGQGGYDLVTYGGTISLFGSFVGYSLGTTTLTDTDSFTGTLLNNTTSQTFTYNNNNGGSIILNNIAAAPEPSAFVALLVGALGLGALTLRARRRSVA